MTKQEKRQIIIFASFCVFLFVFAVLAVCFIVASVFYNHTAISKDSKEYKNGEDKGWFLYKGEKDYKILGPLILVWAIFIISLIIATIYS